MSSIITDITLDLYNYTYVSVNAKRLDSGRSVSVNITNQGATFEVTDKHYVYLRCMRPDGYAVTQSCKIVNGKVIFDLTREMLACSGQALCDLVLMQKTTDKKTTTIDDIQITSSEIISTMKFKINIMESALDSADSLGYTDSNDSIIISETEPIYELNKIWLKPR